MEVSKYPSLTHVENCPTELSEEDLRLKREGQNAFQTFKEMAHNNEGWSVASSGNNGNLIIYMKVINRRKVWKMEAIMPCSALKLFSAIYPGDNTPDWNPYCSFNASIYRVNDTVDILYTVTYAMGPLSSRDFLSVRHMEVDGDHYYSTSKAIVSSIKPEQHGKVRGENGPCGYLVIPVSENQSKLIWVMDANLKGWLPQAVVDRTQTSVLTSAFKKLQVYIQQ